MSSLYTRLKNPTSRSSSALLTRTSHHQVRQSSIDPPLPSLNRQGGGVGTEGGGDRRRGPNSAPSDRGPTPKTARRAVRRESRGSEPATNCCHLTLEGETGALFSPGGRNRRGAPPKSIGWRWHGCQTVGDVWMEGKGPWTPPRRGNR